MQQGGGKLFAQRDVGWLKKWLASHQDETGHFNPQPYQQLAGVLDKYGYFSKAREIRYEAQERRLAIASSWGYAWLWIKKWTIGYGYYPWRAAIGLFILALLAAVVVHCSKLKPELGYQKDHFASVNFCSGCLSSFWYGVDTTIPVVRLNYDNQPIALPAWASIFLNILRFWGFFLASMLAAALAGLVQ